VAYRGGWFGGVQPPPPENPKALKNRAKLNPIWKLLKIIEFRRPTPQDVWNKGSKILKLPNCFTLAMTNKLVVIINSLNPLNAEINPTCHLLALLGPHHILHISRKRVKVPKSKKILLYEMKFLVPNYSCIRNPWLRGQRPQIPFLSVHCPQLNLLNPHPNKIPGYATGTRVRCLLGEGVSLLHRNISTLLELQCM